MTKNKMEKKYGQWKKTYNI